jgi:superfamily I DNA/RNA helicase
MPWAEGLEIGSPAYEIASSLATRIRVIAGPGTGKSFAMKRRVARLLEEGIVPGKILPVTFTRVAAEDLHRELNGMNVPGCEDLEGTTLHGLALRTLMRHHILEATGRTPRPLNDFELKPLYADLKRADRSLKQVKKSINAYQAAWATLQNHQPGYAQTPYQITFEEDLLIWLRFHESILIGEVIPIFYNYLFLNPNAPERSEYLQILVDEYQDLNKAEQELITLLSDNAEVCIVGDDDQSIYSFKHAHPEGIQSWLNPHPNGIEVGLDECRRCPVRVVRMANSLIGRNVLRDENRLLTPREANGQGECHIYQYADNEAETAGITQIVVGLLDAGVLPGEILILAQRKAIGTPIYESLVAADVPSRSYYAEAELNEEHAQYQFALLKLYVSREDRVALRWMLGRESASWLAGGYARLRNHCEQSGASPWDALELLASGQLQIPYTASLVTAFQAIRARLDELEALGNINLLIDEIFPENDISVRDIRAISLAIVDLVAEGDRQAFLNELSSAISRPEVPSEINDVRIMSLHKSKGLSAPVTIIAGCIEGLLPREPNYELTPAERLANLEEQRRVFYVGMTRVKADPANNHPGILIFTYSQHMPLATAMNAGISPASVTYGVANLLPSRFLLELGAAAPVPEAG